MSKMPEGMVFGHVTEALRLGMYHMAAAERHFKDAALDAYSRQIADNLEASRSLQAHALKLLTQYQEDRKREEAQGNQQQEF